MQRLCLFIIPESICRFSTLYRVEGCAASGHRRDIWRPASFSTLYRVEGCAATTPPLVWEGMYQFQYPLSGRRLCSHRPSGRQAWPGHVSVPSIGSKAVQRHRRRVEARIIVVFQYPLSGRRLCSSASILRRVNSRSSFSTLYRVEGCAALHLAERDPQHHACFSTLYRVEGCAARRKGSPVS
ncbi:protein of unknown function [Candidatus Promineifilum breve]|uniref:Uncharacterized protein n=1 Tax=Candidatus Promineifilum breve TaxID=1806508 RepID=A0A170PHH8_9CHLR|nr:protein of unknown function [Candidatus Promineifilum breve]